MQKRGSVVAVAVGFAAAVAMTMAVAAPVHADPETSIGDGTYVVGRDVAAGTYYYSGEYETACGYTYLPSVTATIEDAITGRGNITGPSYMALDDGQIVQTSGGCEWTLKTSSQPAVRTSFGDGTYAVGTDVAAGTYYSPGDDGSLCMYYFLPSISGTMADAISGRGNISGPAYLELADGEIVQSMGCTWTLDQ